MLGTPRYLSNYLLRMEVCLYSVHLLSI